MTELVMTYDQPARQWEETLPVGNGSLGGMVWGGIGVERIGLNQETLWSGYYRDKNNPSAFRYLAQVRRLIQAGRNHEAEAIMAAHMLGENNESYLPLGNLELEFLNQHVASNYRRVLDLDTATATVSYDMNGEHLRREVIASFPHQALLIHLTGRQSFQVRFASLLQHAAVAARTGLTVTGQCPEHVEPEYNWDVPAPILQGTRGQHFQGAVRLLHTDGRTYAYDQMLEVRDATDTLLAVEFVKPAQLPTGATWDQLLSAHVTDYRRLFATVSLDLGPQSDLPVPERLAAVRKGASDPALVALYFQYGRYLMIASARPGSLPPNLQGIWSWQLRAPWSGNWTTDINLEMNCWPLQSCNLLDCFEPFVDFMHGVVKEGEKTARINYHARGFVAHCNLDYWQNTNPVGINYGDREGNAVSVWWGMWPMAGVWLAQEFYKHYEYTKDRDFLAAEVYPVLKEASAFLCDWLVEAPDGELTTCPADSPENQFLLPNGEPAAWTDGVALDLELTAATFRDFLRTTTALGLDDAFIREVAAKAKRVKATRVGEDGRLLEWGQPLPEREPGHRHLSPVFGLYPGDLFATDPKRQAACRKLIESRVAHSTEQIGWSCAWLINLYAILGDGEQAGRFVHNLLVQSTLANLWDSCPPFQIDGNFGAIAGIANMLVQDHGAGVRLLPALPAEWREGSVSGLRIKGGRTVDLTWRDHRLVAHKIHEPKEEASSIDDKI
ncbi:glycoside hydrolase family 95 protein [Lacticaseibacillus suihuaensis]